MFSFWIGVVSLLMAAAVTGNDKTANAQGDTSKNEVDHNEASASPLPSKPYTDHLTFTNLVYQEVFESLDPNKDRLINTEELRSFYYHQDSAFAIKKFMQLLDTTKTPGSIDEGEFKSFMNMEQVKRIIYGISIYVKTREARRIWYADEILSYVYLVLDYNAINKLFNALESRVDGKLDLNEITEMEMKLMNGNIKYKLTEPQAKMILAEMGAGSDTISFEDFKTYLLDGELGFLFRECRIKLTDDGAEYDNPCLIRNLILFATRRMTEYTATLLFDALDAKPKDHKLHIEDVKAAFGCDTDKAKRFISYVGLNADEVSYGAFRVTMDMPEIASILISECSSEKETEIHIVKRIECMKWKLWDLSSQTFFGNYFGVPDLDLIFLFEDLDTSNDGTIEEKKDLEEGRHWKSELAKKFIDEILQNENKGKVNLDDFIHYTYTPFMMNGLGECQQVKENSEKLACYNREMEDIIIHVLDKDEVRGFFRFYPAEKRELSDNTNKQNNQKTTYEVISSVTLQTMNPKMTDDEINNFIFQLGMGDSYVNIREFDFFVKQQEPSHLFSTDDKSAIPRKHFGPDELHKKLMFYLKNYLTEYDLIALFLELDQNHDSLLDKHDIEKIPDILDADLIRRMAVFGNPEHATMQEMWLFLNSKPQGSQEPRKRQLEADCAKEEKIECLKRNLKTVK